MQISSGEINFNEEQKIIDEGHEEALKDRVKLKEQNEEKLNKLVSNSNSVIFTCKTIFPFTIFPNTLIVTLNDVSIVNVEFFISKQIRSVPIKKIAEIIVETGFFFATVKIIDIDFSQITMELNYLNIGDAMRAKRLIQGLLFASKEEIDLTKIEDLNIVSKLEELGKIQGEKLDEF